MKCLLALVLLGATLSAGSAAAGPRPLFGVQRSLGPASANGTETSTNWAGYAVTHRKPFASVTGRWIQPAATCSAVDSTYSAFWVGLGGFASNSFAVEQTGTLANCKGGSASYTAWYELYPKPPVMVRMAVRPGDVLSATVTVAKKTVLIRLKDVTRGKLFTKKLRMNRPDLGSAEWVAEAPSGCDLTGNCSTLPLTNFGTVAFSHASAAVKGHKGRISDPVWSATTIELHSDDPTHPSTAGANAIPGALGPDGGSFAVTWQQAPTP
ncbi:MAG TPA: G1 family glutamic endopeptidase [Gaiellaceae bacterium]